MQPVGYESHAFFKMLRSTQIVGYNRRPQLFKIQNWLTSNIHRVLQQNQVHSSCARIREQITTTPEIVQPHLRWTSAQCEVGNIRGIKIIGVTNNSLHNKTITSILFSTSG